MVGYKVGHHLISQVTKDCEHHEHQEHLVLKALHGIILAFATLIESDVGYGDPTSYIAIHVFYSLFHGLFHSHMILYDHLYILHFIYIFHYFSSYVIY
jgi:hypothetical protein